MAGTWDFIRSWLTLPVVFVVVNIVIGTIAVTSAWWKNKNPNANGRPSALTRLMSGTFSRRAIAMDDDDDLPSNNNNNNSFQSQDSLLRKPRGVEEPEEPGIEPWTGPRPKPKPLEDIREVSDSDEVPSTGAGIEPGTSALGGPRLGKSKSDTPAELQAPPPPPPGVKKSGSFDSIFSGTGAGPLDLGVAAKAEDGAQVDAEAEDFIQRFKNQLKLQRLQSMLRYKEMIDRGK